jgi:hypothetical protein
LGFGIFYCLIFLFVVFIPDFVLPQPAAAGAKSGCSWLFGFYLKVAILPPTPSEGEGDLMQRVLWNIVFWVTFGLLKFLKVGMSSFLLRRFVMPTKEVSHYMYTVSFLYCADFVCPDPPRREQNQLIHFH